MATLFNSGDVAFMMLTTLLVFIMTPGLAFFYGGLVERKNALTMMYYTFIAIGVVTIMWIFGGFSLVFGDDIAGVIGNPAQYFMLNGVDLGSNSHFSSSVPFIMFFIYQLMFAIITAPLMTGAFANRLTPSGWIKMLIIWMLLIYFPVAHCIWGGGFLSTWGFVDYAGGTVIHTTAGFSALIAVIMFGRRKALPKRGYGNLNLVLIGTTLLMFGWFGFNSGGALAANNVAAIAFVNTGIAAAVALTAWVVISYITKRRLSFVELATGAVAGLATITPAAGYVTPQAAMLIGALAAIGCYFCVEVLRQLDIDDALGVWGVHGMGGFMGTLYVGIFASAEINGVEGGLRQFLIQLSGAGLVAIYSMFIMWFIVMLTRGDVSAEVQRRGLDSEYFGDEED